MRGQHAAFAIILQQTCVWLLNPTAGYAILKTEKGKAIEAATLKSKKPNLHQAVTIAVVAAIFVFP